MIRGMNTVAKRLWISRYVRLPPVKPRNKHFRHTELTKLISRATMVESQALAIWQVPPHAPK